MTKIFFYTLLTLTKITTNSVPPYHVVSSIGTKPFRQFRHFSISQTLAIFLLNDPHINPHLILTVKPE